jgi:cysteine desulfurase
VALPGVRADAQVIALDLAGVAVSAGAACSSGKVATSHVLTAMGLGPLAGEAIRVSLPWNAGADDVAAFAAAYERFRSNLSRYAREDGAERQVRVIGSAGGEESAGSKEGQRADPISLTLGAGAPRPLPP